MSNVSTKCSWSGTKKK